MMGLATLLAKVGSTLRAVFRCWRSGGYAVDLDHPIYYERGYGPGDGDSHVIDRDHYLRERYGLEEKPEGWNDAVLGYFHGGPELREKDEDYRSAFAERAERAAANAGISKDERRALTRASTQRSYFDRPLRVGPGGKIVDRDLDSPDRAA